jgi:Flp pilus assembly pilin Flp
MDQVMRVIRGESGATSAEYALMTGLIIVVIAGAVQLLGTGLIPAFTNAASGIAGS